MSTPTEDLVRALLSYEFAANELRRAGYVVPKLPEAERAWELLRPKSSQRVERGSPDPKKGVVMLRGLGSCGTS